MTAPQRVAIVHEWFTSMRGGEKCVEALCELFPDATLFVLLHNKGSVSPTIERMPIRTSWIQHLPFASQNYRYYLPLFPLAASQFNLKGFDLVISSHHCVAKGVKTDPDALHICYCHTPMRYIWGHYDEYFGPGRTGFPTRVAMRLTLPFLRKWDVQTAVRPRAIVANSENVCKRIRSIYDRDSLVIYPPVDTTRFPENNSEDFFLIVSALVPYKRVDLAIEACKQTSNRLVIVGDGPEAKQLHALAGQNIEFRGWVSDMELAKLYSRCRAVLFPGEEDFGIVPVEAMAAGKPVVAFGKGGALETVLVTPEHQTGVLFQEQTVDAMVRAIKQCSTMHFDPRVLREHAMKFDKQVFKKRISEFIQMQWDASRSKSPQP